MVILKLLESIPFFWEFTSDELLLLAESDSYFINYKAGDYLLREGDATDRSLMILIRGSVRVSRKSAPDNTISRLETGAVIGEISFLTKRPRTTNVIADSDATVFRLDEEGMARMDLRLQNRIKDQLIEVLVRRLDAMNEALAKVIR